MAGITSLGVDDDQSGETIDAATQIGVNFFDTAYSYGYSGESDRILLQASRRNRIFQPPATSFTIASKVGQHWNGKRERIVDASPGVLMAHTQELLLRLETDSIDLLYLHGPDGRTPMDESASAMKEIRDRGWAKCIGVCNVDLEQAQQFVRNCPTDAIQIPFNMLQQDRLVELRSFADSQKIALVCYWVLMKGLLAGQMSRDHQFALNDVRANYPIFQGQAWERAHDLLDKLREISERLNCSIPSIVTQWALAPKRADVVLVGAKSPLQMSCFQDNSPRLSSSELAEIDDFLESLRSA